MYGFVPSSFFSVYFDGLGIGMSGEFTSVSGLGVEFEWETYQEGGSSYPRRFLKGVVPQTLVLEQGTVTTFDNFSTWMLEINQGITRSLDGIVIMRDHAGAVVRNWTIIEAMPTKYVGPALTSLQSTLAVTRVEFLYNGCF
jgi:phage tail-like protein